MLYKETAENNQAFKKYSCAILLTLFLISIVSCSKKNDAQSHFPIGIWQGSFLDKPISIEFHKNGSAILTTGNGDEIVLARYSLNIDKQPGHLDFVLFNRSRNEIKGLIKKVDENNMRIEMHEGEMVIPTEFTSNSFLMHRTKEHILPENKTLEQRNEELKQLDIKESIWFETKDHNKFLDICEELVRDQIAKSASVKQLKTITFFLSIYNSDPPEDLMARLKQDNLPIQLGSGFQMGTGTKFEINNIKMIDKYNIEIKVEFYSGPLAATGNTFKLRKKYGTWKVISEKMDWIS